MSGRVATVFENSRKILHSTCDGQENAEDGDNDCHESVYDENYCEENAFDENACDENAEVNFISVIRLICPSFSEGDGM